MNHRFRALGLILGVVVWVAAACATPPAPPPGGPGPGSGFPEPGGCYQLGSVLPTFGSTIYLLFNGPIDAAANAEFRVDSACGPLPAGTTPAFVTVVHAESTAAAIAKCAPLEPGTTFGWDSTIYLLSGTPDYYLCAGGVLPGDCIGPRISPGQPWIKYVGPADSLNNAEFHAFLPGGFDPQCSNAASGQLTIVQAGSGPEAVSKCQGIASSFIDAINLQTDGYVFDLSLLFVEPLYRCT